MGVVHERESYTSKPPALSENLPSFPSSSLSLLIVLHWLLACENSVGVQLNSLGSNLGPNWKIQVAFTFGLSIHSKVLFLIASPQRFHGVPALLYSMPRDWPPHGRKASIWVGDTASPYLAVQGGQSSSEHKLFLKYQIHMEPTQNLGMGSAQTTPLLFTRATAVGPWRLCEGALVEWRRLQCQP